MGILILGEGGGGGEKNYLRWRLGWGVTREGGGVFLEVELIKWGGG